LLGRDSEIDKSLKSLEGLDISIGLAFKDQLMTDEIILHAEIGDMQYRLERVESYCKTTSNKTKGNHNYEPDASHRCQDGNCDDLR
jgi:hypothetical protein